MVLLPQFACGSESHLTIEITTYDTIMITLIAINPITQAEERIEGLTLPYRSLMWNGEMWTAPCVNESDEFKAKAACPHGTLVSVKIEGDSSYTVEEIGKPIPIIIIRPPLLEREKVQEEEDDEQPVMKKKAGTLTCPTTGASYTYGGRGRKPKWVMELEEQGVEPTPEENND